MHPVCDEISREDNTLVETATSLINVLAASGAENTFEFGGLTLKLHAVLRAMLFHAAGCGGEAGQRYIAHNISLCAAQDDPRCDHTPVMLRDLATTWIRHFLFVFWVNASRSAQQDRVDSFSEDNTRSFKDKLLERDGYRCIATGKPDVHHPSSDEDLSTYLIGCHIIRRMIPIYDSREDPEAYNSAMATFNIFRNYAGLSEKTLQDLEDNTDSPANGILLSLESHIGFSKFRWCLQETDYKIKTYGRGHGIGKGVNSKVVDFKDHSAKFQTGQNGLGCKIPLPEVCYLRIHAAIAGILHMSGAGEFFDELLEKYDSKEGSSPVQSWEELDKVVEMARLREQLSAMDLS
ncbi:hypothetical protein BD779DRAFT_1676135 [Infundibulicybe gibba]|nr:hypothetical protein BD779DRAFT_1676135 [Infundibulicybe gibba]